MCSIIALSGGIFGLVCVGLCMVIGNTGYLFWASESLGLSAMVCYSPALFYGRKI